MHFFIRVKTYFKSSILSVMSSQPSRLVFVIVAQQIKLNLSESDSSIL